MVKKGLLVVMLMVVMFNFGFARNQAGSFRVGLYSPMEDWLKPGVSFSGEYGINVDEQVDVVLGIDFFKKTVTDKSDLENNNNINVPEQGAVILSEWNAIMLPILAKANMTFPVGEKISVFATGGLGYEILFVSYTGADTLGGSIDESTTYGGFDWQVGGGISLKLGYKSALTADITYNSGQVSRKEDNIEWEVDTSGIFARIGLTIHFY